MLNILSLANVHILCTLKTPENLCFFCVFMGTQNGNNGQKWVNKLYDKYRNTSNNVKAAMQGDRILSEGILKTFINFHKRPGCSF